MEELIKRSAVLRDLETLWDYSTVDGITASTVLKQVMTDIRNVPAVDAVPVVHGYWIKRQNPQWKAYSHDMCSVCGWWNTKNALCYDGNHKPGHSLNYCPNCGAKMDGKDEDGRPD